MTDLHSTWGHRVGVLRHREAGVLPRQVAGALRRPKNGGQRPPEVGVLRRLVDGGHYHLKDGDREGLRRPEVGGHRHQKDGAQEDHHRRAGGLIPTTGCHLTQMPGDILTPTTGDLLTLMPGGLRTRTTGDLRTPTIGDHHTLTTGDLLLVGLQEVPLSHGDRSLPPVLYPLLLWGFLLRILQPMDHLLFPLQAVPLP